MRSDRDFSDVAVHKQNAGSRRGAPLRGTTITYVTRRAFVLPPSRSRLFLLPAPAARSAVTSIAPGYNTEPSLPSLSLCPASFPRHRFTYAGHTACIPADNVLVWKTGETEDCLGGLFMESWCSCFASLLNSRQVLAQNITLVIVNEFSWL